MKHWSKTTIECIQGDASGVTGVRTKARGEKAGAAPWIRLSRPASSEPLVEPVKKAETSRSS